MKRIRAEDLELPRSSIERLIDEWIFNENHRAILKRRLLDGITMEGLAEEFNYSTDRIKEIVHKAQSQLFKHLS